MQRTITGMRFGSLAVVGAASLLALAGASVNAQGVESSTWNALYGDNAGSFKVSASLRLQGESGSYYPAGGLGSLNGITYRPSITGGTLVSGNWSYAGTQGWFAYDVTAGGASFNGSWGYGPYTGQPPVGYWRGQRTGGGAPVPVPVPLPPPVPVPFPKP